MTIYERKWKNSRGEIQTAWRVKVRTPAGREVSRQFPTKREAKAFLLNPKGLSASDASPEVVAILVEDWYTMIKSGGADEPLDDATLRMYRGHLDNHIIPEMGPLKWSQVTEGRIERLRDTLLSRVGRSTAKRVLNTFKRVVRYAKDQGLISQDPGVSVSIRGARGRHRDPGLPIHTRPQMTAILAALDDLCERPGKAWIWQKYRVMINVAVFTGLRASELLGLSINDIHPPAGNKPGWIDVRQRVDRFGRLGPPKTGSAYRSVVLTDKTYDLLVNYTSDSQAADSSPVLVNGFKARLPLAFATRTGKAQFHSNFVSRGWIPAQQAAGVPVLNFHSVRHYYASSLISKRATPLQLQKAMGHSSPEFTMAVYGHLFGEAEERIAMRKIVEEIAGDHEED